MNRSDLIQAFSERTGLAPKEAEWFVRTFFEALAVGLKQDERIELRGFGVFRLSHRNQAGFQNPKNGKYYGSLGVRTIKFYASTRAESEGL